MDDPRITSETNDPPVPPRADYYDNPGYDRPRASRADYQKDREHLNLLAIFYFVFCGLECFGLLAGFVYIGLGIVLLTSGTWGGGGGGGAPPAELGFFMIGVGVLVILLAGAFATCLGLTGHYLRKRKKRIFCFVIACILCISVPLGTLLGVFTILVLQRESVKKLFQYGDQPPGTGGRYPDDDA